MIKTITELMWTPYNAEIIYLCDGKHSITDIQKEIGFTYKSILERLKQLEEGNIIETSNKKHTISKPIISEKNKEKVMRDLWRIINTQKEFEKMIKEKQNKETAKKILGFLSETRYVDKMSFFRKFAPLDADTPNLMLIFGFMKDSCLIKERYELTKKGKAFLKKI